MVKNKIKIKTIFGQILTIDVSEQTDKHIIGNDKFGNYVKVKLEDIENSVPLSKGDDL
jgi:hypothetical protein